MWRPRRCARVCLSGVLVSLLSIVVVLGSRWYLSRQSITECYTPLTGEAVWQGDWELSEQGADPSPSGSMAGTDRVIIPFSGHQLALRVRRGSYRAYLWVSVDGKPANRLPRTDRGAYLVLSSPDYNPQLTSVPVAGSLKDGDHTAEIVADRGWDQWPLAGWCVTRGPDALRLDGVLQALAGLVIVCLIGAVGWAMVWARETATSGHTTTHRLWPWAGLRWELPASVLEAPITMIAAAIVFVVFYASTWPPMTLVSGVLLAAVVLLRLDLGLAMVAFSAPFYLHPRPLLGKSFSMAEIATLLCLVSWGARRAQRPIPRSWAAFLGEVSAPDLAVLFLALTATVSTLFAEYTRVALRELRVVIVEPILFYLMLRTSKLGGKDAWSVADAFVAGAGAVALIGLAQYALGINVITAEQGFRRLRSVYGSPNNAALYLGRALPVLLAVAQFGAARRRRVAYGILAVPVVVGLVLTFSRAAILLGVPASLVALGVLARGRWRWMALGLLVMTVGVTVSLLGTPRFAGLLDPASGTLFFRVQLWRASWSMFRDHLWLGVGPDNFLYAYRGWYISPAAWQEPHLSHAHNFVLTYATRLGIMGVLAAGCLQVCFWWRVLMLRGSRSPDRRALAAGLMGSMAYTLAHGMVDASYFFVDLAFAFLLTLGLVQLIGKGEIYEQQD